MPLSTVPRILPTAPSLSFRPVTWTQQGPNSHQVTVHLPNLSEEDRVLYPLWETQWRPAGSLTWNTHFTPSRENSYRLPSNQRDGTYEVRVRASGSGQSTPYSALRRYSLQSRVGMPTKSVGADNKLFQCCSV